MSANYVNVPEIKASGVSSIGDFTLVSNSHSAIRFIFADFHCDVDHHLVSSQGGANQVYRIDMTCNGDRNDIKNARGWMSISKNPNNKQDGVIRASSPVCAEGNSEYHPHGQVVFANF